MKLTNEQLAIRLANWTDKMEKVGVKPDEIVTHQYAQILAERMTNAHNEKEAEKIFDIIERHCGSVTASDIWDYGISWKKLKWVPEHGSSSRPWTSRRNGTCACRLYWSDSCRH